ncbi:MAG: hypothetical protein AAFP26_14440, partial [Planctomycetota bacterium]
MVSFVAVLAMVAALQAGAVRGTCPVECTCDERLDLVNCSHGGFDTVPKRESGTPTLGDLFTDPYIKKLLLALTGDKETRRARELDLSDKNLTALSGSSFEDFPKLKSLRLDRNRLHEFRARQPSVLRHLRNLTLSHNLLGPVLTRGAFRAFASLWWLDLTANRYRSIEPVALPESIRRLDMADNPIVTVAPDAFARLDALGSLDLGGMAPAMDRGTLYDVFNHLDAVRVLRVGGAESGTLEADTLAHLHLLDELSLNGLGLATLPAMLFVDTPRLRSLQLVGNRLTRLPRQPLIHL